MQKNNAGVARKSGCKRCLYGTKFVTGGNENWKEKIKFPFESN